MSLIILFCFILTFHFLSVLQFGYFLLLALEFINPIFCLSSFLLNLCSEFRFHIFCISELDKVSGQYHRTIWDWAESGYGLCFSKGQFTSSLSLFLKQGLPSLFIPILMCPYFLIPKQEWRLFISILLKFWTLPFSSILWSSYRPSVWLRDSVCLSQVFPSGRALPIEHWKFIRDFLLSFSRFFLFLKHVEHNLEAQTMPQWGKLAAHSRLSKFSASCPFVCHGLSLFFSSHFTKSM